MLDKLRNLSRLVRSLTRSGRSTRRSHPSAIAEPIEPRLLLAMFILYVDANSPAATPDGLSWSTAYPDLQLALAAAKPAANDTCEIRIADGTYRPTARTVPFDLRTAAFSLKSGVALLGGYAGHGAPDPDVRDIASNATILSGDIGTANLASDNAYHVVISSGTDATAVLDGLTITAGYAISGSTSGGGLYNTDGCPTVRNCSFIANRGVYGGAISNNSRPTLSNCVFSGNTAIYGGGMYNSGLSASPTLVNCTFSGNTNDLTTGLGGGGGMYNDGNSSPVLEHCTFTANTAIRGGGMYNYPASPTLTDCTFTGNAALLKDCLGGGMYNRSSSPTLTNCAFYDNAAGEHGQSSAGGGMYNDTASPTLVNCVFDGNHAEYNAGGIYSLFSSPTLTGCSFIRNRAGSLGGAMVNTLSATKLIRCTFSLNSGETGGGICNNGSLAGVFPVLRACTFQGNTADSNGGAVANSSSSPTLVNCSFSGNVAHAGAGIHNDQKSSPALVNCTLTGNVTLGPYYAVCNVAASYPSLTNCIVWGNTAPMEGQSQFGANAAIVTYSNVQGGYKGTGNINSDPLFARKPDPGVDGVWGTGDDDYGDLRPRFISPMVDAGWNSAVPSDVDTDLSGNARLADVLSVPDTGSGAAPIVDMGAYEVVPKLEAHAGGPYVLLEGSTMVLHGFGQNATPGDLSFAWDFDGDGFFDDAAGEAPIFSADAFSGPLTLAIVLRVTDAAGASATESTTVTIPQVVYVDDSAAGAGTSWADACTNLQAALARSEPGQVIRVARGTYTPTADSDRAISFQLKNDVAILGGYAGHGAPNPDARDSIAYSTVLSGEIGHPGSSKDNSYHVVTGGGTDATAIMDGFRIMAGCADGLPVGPDRGGGMYNDGGSPTVRNCTFTGNTAQAGGGIYNHQSAVTLTDCQFIGNTAFEGGGMAGAESLPTLVGCSFMENAAWRGAGVMNSLSWITLTNCSFLQNASQAGGGAILNRSALTLIDCSFTANAAYQGGAIYNDSGAVNAVMNCTFTANVAAAQGGGLYNASSSLTLVNCSIGGNSASDGGGIYNASCSPVVTNCTFSGNSATISHGGGMYNASSSPTVKNCTFVSNRAFLSGGGIYNSSASPVLANCILWNNAASAGGQIQTASGTPAITYSDVQGGYAGSGNIDADPLFISANAGPDGNWGTADDEYGNLQLQLISPCIDAGRNDSVPASILTDRGGQPRFVDISSITDTGLGSAPLVDMGAYEATHPAPVPLILPATDGLDTLTLRLSPDGLSLQYWPAGSIDGQPAAVYPLSGLTTCSFAPSLGLDTLRLDFSNGVPIPAAGLILPADDQIIVTASDTTRPELLHTLRALLAAGRIASTSDDPARALCPWIDDDGDILIRLALRGDLTGDDALDGDDYFALDRAFLMQDDLTPQADLTLDNRIDAADYFLLDRAFLTLAPPAPAASAPSSTLFDPDPDLDRLRDLIL